MGRRLGVRAASSSSIEIDFYYNGVRCKERMKLEPTKANLRYAERLRGEILNAIERGTFDYAEIFPNSRKTRLFARLPGQTETVKDYLSRWIMGREAFVKASTWKDERRTVNNHLIPAFGVLTLTQLTRADIKEWAAKLTASNKRIGNLLSPLRVALDEAVDDGLIEVNPLKNWSYRRRARPGEVRNDARIDPFSVDERETILSHAQNQIRNMFEFQFWTGLRTSERVTISN